MFIYTTSSSSSSIEYSMIQSKHKNTTINTLANSYIELILDILYASAPTRIYKTSDEYAYRVWEMFTIYICLYAKYIRFIYEYICTKQRCFHFLG